MITDSPHHAHAHAIYLPLRRWSCTTIFRRSDPSFDGQQTVSFLNNLNVNNLTVNNLTVNNLAVNNL